MRDPQIFEEYVLENGIKLFHYPQDVPFAMVRVRIPFGHLNNTGQILPGSAHFLEHMVLKRSLAYPERDSFTKIVELDGGSLSARTSEFETEFLLDIPGSLQKQTVNSFFDQIFNPIFKNKDIEIEKQAVISERKRRVWYPSSNSLGKYICTQWMQLQTSSLEQVFGSDEDLAKVDDKYMDHLRHLYYGLELTVLTGGNVSCSLMQHELNKLKIQKRKLDRAVEMVGWAQKEFHEYPSREVGRYALYLGAVFRNLPSPQVCTAVKFILNMLTNTAHGVLYEWLRRNLGWSYEVKGQVFESPYKFGWLIELPVQSRKQVEVVRQEVHGIISRVITDGQFIELEIARVIKSKVFLFQTLGSILDSALDDLTKHGRIVSETEHAKAIRQCADVDFLKSIYNQYFQEELVGEFCAIPEN